MIHFHSFIWVHLDEGVHATFSSALPTSHCAYKALFSVWTLGRVAVCFAVAFHYVKQVHCCIWNYVRKEWHFTVDEVWGNLQGSSTDVQVNSFGIYLSGQSMFKLSHLYNRNRTEQEPLPPASMIFFLRVWLLGKHFCMVSEQRRFVQLLHWQAFSYQEKATCSIVASHCMTKHDLMIFSQMSLLLLLPGLLLRPRLWLRTLYQSRKKNCSAQVEHEIIEVPVSPCFIQWERWLFVLPV